MNQTFLKAPLVLAVHYSFFSLSQLEKYQTCFPASLNPGNKVCGWESSYRHWWRCSWLEITFCVGKILFPRENSLFLLFPSSVRVLCLPMLRDDGGHCWRFDSCDSSTAINIVCLVKSTSQNGPICVGFRCVQKHAYHMGPSTFPSACYFHTIQFLNKNHFIFKSNASTSISFLLLEGISQKNSPFIFTIFRPTLGVESVESA